ncbi:helix-turn-helix transcriptional regulator [Flavobacterium sp. NRK1]|uniref:helix-turn-helix domain-containing protein n=1 Tax=Flavobacterium sp. NRK1 TaxID=2954929 RepID=UPI0020924B41|nr:helix-turn-helix transcriptional regulator [Flavobacterium sp. NRK1]MCO6149476.1 helix-turn-helix domain-containing protein [Flavobacterium sp. NRK1]
MVNTEDFVKRLEIILEFYGLSASVFADKMSVQRSALSHLMSGRNKPSLDFVMKIIDNFPEVDFYWLVNGAGNFPKSEAVQETDKKEYDSPPPISAKGAVSLDLFSSEDKTSEPEIKKELDIKPDTGKTVESVNNKKANENSIERIVIFYNNGTYKEYISGN